MCLCVCVCTNIFIHACVFTHNTNTAYDTVFCEENKSGLRVFYIKQDDRLYFFLKKSDILAPLDFEKVP